MRMMRIYEDEDDAYNDEDDAYNDVGGGKNVCSV